jgi:hypothetical protein
VRLGLTPEEVREVVEEQERWFREEYQQELVDRARESIEHQEQQQHQNEARWVPTPPIDDSKPTPQAYEIPNEPPENVTSPYDDSLFEHRDSPAVWYQPPTPIPDNTPPPPQLEHDQYDTTNKYNEHVIPFMVTSLTATTPMRSPITMP